VPVIGIRQLSRQTAEVFDALEKTGEPVVIARHGKPIAALIQIDESRLTELIVASTPEFVDDWRAADEALARGDVQPMTEVIAELSAARESETAAPTPSDLGHLVGIAIDTPEYKRVIESVSRAAVETAPIELKANQAEQISVVNERLARELVAEAMSTAMAAALERVRRLNERIAQLAAREEAPATSYVQMLDRVAEAQHLSASTEVAGQYPLNAGTAGAGR
jgi:prevent-host-death family protein